MAEAAVTLTAEQLSRFASEISDILWANVDLYADEAGTSFVSDAPKNRVLVAVGVAAERMNQTSNAEGDLWLEVAQAITEGDVLALDAEGYAAVLLCDIVPASSDDAPPHGIQRVVDLAEYHGGVRCQAGSE